MCNLCGSSFAANYQLKRHVEAVHEGIKPKPRKPKGESANQAASAVFKSEHLRLHPSFQHVIPEIMQTQMNQQSGPSDMRK